jgi:uncharacterized membrane protein
MVPRSMMRRLSILTAGFCVLLIGCRNSDLDGAVDAGTEIEPLCAISIAPGCPAPEPIFADVKPIFEQRCAVCHNGQPGGPWALNDYNHIADWQEAVSQMIAECEMPPADSGVLMTVEEREKILRWVQCGVRP